MDAFDAPHQAAEIGGVRRRVWQTMLEVQGAYSSEVEFDGLRFEGVGEVGSKEHEGVLGCRERGAVGVESVVCECKVLRCAEEYDKRVEDARVGVFVQSCFWQLGGRGYGGET